MIRFDDWLWIVGENKVKSKYELCVKKEKWSEFFSFNMLNYTYTLCLHTSAVITWISIVKILFVSDYIWTELMVKLVLTIKIEKNKKTVLCFYEMWCICSSGYLC